MDNPNVPAFDYETSGNHDVLDQQELLPFAAEATTTPGRPPREESGSAQVVPRNSPEWRKQRKGTKPVGQRADDVAQGSRGESSRRPTQDKGKHRERATLGRTYIAKEGQTTDPWTPYSLQPISNAFEGFGLTGDARQSDPDNISDSDEFEPEVHAQNSIRYRLKLFWDTKDIKSVYRQSRLEMRADSVVHPVYGDTRDTATNADNFLERYIPALEIQDRRVRDQRE
ncbi:hypothetical protein FPV67DRAFT_1447005 [Lyophyllum atratum]|nr:hypothetical protein FPV67DRAFT_1456137 [Lyophyllum atratum]KAF8071445.1 hypothetical protein FPV67DRAFT_1447005 [Lyophyllum atratum]